MESFIRVVLDLCISGVKAIYVQVWGESAILRLDLNSLGQNRVKSSLAPVPPTAIH